MLKRFLDWVIYGDCSQEPSDNIEFLKGLRPAAGTKLKFPSMKNYPIVEVKK